MSTKLKEVPAGLSSEFQKKIVLGPDGAGTLSDEAIAETLPEGLTMELVQKVHEHRDNVIAAATDAFATLSHAAMKKDKNLAETSLQFNFYKDAAGVNVYRTREGRNPANGEKTVAHGAVSNKYVARGAQNVGQLKVARTRARELFADIAG